MPKQNTQASQLITGPLPLICRVITVNIKASTTDNLSALLEKLAAFDTDEVLQALRWHHLQIPFWFAVKDQSQHLPKALIQPLKRQFHEMQFKLLAQQATLQHLDQVLGEHGIVYIPFKGILLSQQLSASSSSRYSKDLDIWVAIDDIERTEAALIDAGYTAIGTQITAQKTKQRRETLQVRKDKVLLSPQKPHVEVELHWRLDKNKHAYNIDFAKASAALSTVQLHGHDYTTFSLPLYLRYLPIHGSMAMWGRLKWLLDWHNAATVAHETGFDWQALANELKKTGLLQPTLLAMQLSHSLFGQTPPAAFNAYKLSALSTLTLKIVHSSLAGNQYPSLRSRWIMRFFLRRSLAYKTQHIYLMLRQIGRPDLRA